MLASASQTIAPKPAALPPAAQPALPGGGSAGGPSFAQFLNDQPVTLPSPPAHADPVPKEPEPPTSAPAPAAATTRRPVSPAPAKPTPSRAPEAAAADKPGQKAVSDKDGDDSTVAATDAAQDPETSGLEEFTQLIGLTPQALPAQAVPVATLPGAETAEGDTPAGKPAARGRINRLADEEGTTVSARKSGAPDTASSAATERRPADAPAHDAAPRAKGVELAATAAAAAADKAAARTAGNNEALQTAAANGGASTPPIAATTDNQPTSFAAVLAQAMPALAAASDTAPASASGQVRAAVHSSAFAPELGASVSLLAVDGVQQAELQLNPADMGPVNVQIVVDGNQAQVSFHAVHAETRQALEQSLPDLAAALQSQGLTLSGGGVFQQASRDPQGGDAEGGRDDGRGSRSASAGARIGASGAATATPARRSVGLLDTFA